MEREVIKNMQRTKGPAKQSKDTNIKVDEKVISVLPQMGWWLLSVK